jgi:hypothetical protein
MPDNLKNSLGNFAHHLAITDPSAEKRIDARDTVIAESEKVKTVTVPKHLLGTVDDKPVVVTPMVMERLEVGLRIAKLTKRLAPHSGNQKASIKMTNGRNMHLSSLAREVGNVVRLKSSQRDSLTSAKLTAYLGSEYCKGLADLVKELALALGIPVQNYQVHGHAFSVLYPDDGKENQVVVDTHSVFATVCPAANYRYPFTAENKKRGSSRLESSDALLDLNQVFEAQQATKKALDALPAALLKGTMQEINKKIEEREKMKQQLLLSDPPLTPAQIEEKIRRFNLTHALPENVLKDTEEAQRFIMERYRTKTFAVGAPTWEETSSFEILRKSEDKRDNLIAEKRAGFKGIRQIRNAAINEARNAAEKAAVETGASAMRAISKTGTVVHQEGEAEVAFTLTVTAKATHDPAIWRTSYNASTTTYHVEGGEPKNFAVAPEESIDDIRKVLEELG